VVLAEGTEQVEQDQRDVAVVARLLRLPVQDRVQRAGVVVQSGRVEEQQLRARPVLDPEDPAARGLRLGAHDRELLAEDRVQERRLARVRPPEDRDRARAVHAHLSSARRASAAAAAARSASRLLRPVPVP
jgi:hypothetical protein